MIFKILEHFSRSEHGLGARYLSGLRPGQPKSENVGFPGRTEKLRAEKLCRLMVVSHRVLHFSSLLCPFKIVDVQLILLISGAIYLLIRLSKCSLNLATNRTTCFWHSDYQTGLFATIRRPLQQSATRVCVTAKGVLHFDPQLLELHRKLTETEYSKASIWPVTPEEYQSFSSSMSEKTLMLHGTRNLWVDDNV